MYNALAFESNPMKAKDVFTLKVDQKLERHVRLLLVLLLPILETQQELITKLETDDTVEDVYGNATDVHAFGDVDNSE